MRISNACPKCDRPLESTLVFTARRIWVGAFCEPCNQSYDPVYGGSDRRVDVGGADGRVMVTTIGKTLVIDVGPSRITLPTEQADAFCEAVGSFGSTIRRRVSAERVEREQLERWLLHKDGATFRSQWDGHHHVTLRQTIPRRDWNCSVCDAVLPAATGHWLGVFTGGHYGRPFAPRFCSLCVHGSREVEVSEPEVPKGLRLVETVEASEA